MRQTIITAVAAFALGGITTGVLLAQAQPAAGPTDGPAAMHDNMGGPGMAPGGGMGGWRARGPWRADMAGRHAQRMHLMRTFALIYRADDRKLTPPDVQKVVEGFLLWNGNHSWRVLNVKPDGDAIGFDLATKEGAVIASFTMDPKTGELTRKG